MTWRACDHGDGPEPLPPEELLRTRRVLAEPTRPEIRGQHVAAAAAEARRAHALSSAQAIARRSARVIAGVAATIVVTSSLAGAQILVEPARAIFPAVSEHLIPNRSADQDPSDYVGVDDAEDAESDESSTTQADRGTAKATKPVVQDSVTTSQTVKKTTSTTVAPTSSSTTSTSSSSTTTTEPDGSTTTTEPDGSTTTTEPDGSTTTTEPDGSTTTTTTSAPAETTTKSPPAWGRGPG